jgi:uncharacterized integral membrane protein
MAGDASKGRGDPSALADELGSVEKGRPFQWGVVVGGVVAVAAALLVVQNGHTTGLEWLWFDFDAPLWLLLALTLAAGGFLAEAGRIVWRRRRVRAAERSEVVSAARRRLKRG